MGPLVSHPREDRVGHPQAEGTVDSPRNIAQVPKGNDLLMVIQQGGRTHEVQDIAGRARPREAPALSWWIVQPVRS